MREIKFRAWDSKNKEMLSAQMSNIYRNKYSLFDDIYLLQKENFGDTVRVDLMQYIGIKDKNNVEIYEGDILKLDIYSFADADEPTIFTFNDYAFDLPYITQINQFIENYEDDPDFHDSIEVIGNLYQNTDLSSK